MANDRAFIARQSAYNRRAEKTSVRAANKWADNLVTRQAAQARATRACGGCGVGVRTAARFCENCGKELDT